MYSSRICHVSGVRKGFTEIHRNTRGIQEEYTQNTQNTNLRANPTKFKGKPPLTRSKGKSRGSYERGVNSRIHSPVADSRARTHV